MKGPAWLEVTCPTCHRLPHDHCRTFKPWKIMGFDFYRFASHPHVARIAAGKIAEARKNKRGGAHNHNGSRKRR